MTIRFTTSDGVSLAYEQTGAGLPLLCLPGLTRDARDFDDLRAVLPAGLRMICLTSRGRGASDPSPDPMDYTVAVEARDVLELMDHLALPRAVILGTSRGGLIAMVLAATARDRLAGVLLNDIGPELDPTGLERIMDYIGIAPTARDHDSMARALEQGLGPAFPGLPPARWRVLSERWYVETGEGLGLRYDPRLRVPLEAAGSAAPPDLWPLFEALDGIPLAVLRGANSDLLSPEGLARMQARRPDMIAATVPDRGHVPFLDEAESLATLRELISRIPA